MSAEPAVPAAPVDGSDPEAGIAALADEIAEAFGQPMERLAVAALLESKGLRDVDAIEIYGHRHIFGLAFDVYDRVEARFRDDRQTLEHVAEVRPLHRLRRFVVLYAKGTLFALPMTGQIIAILLLRYSLWAWLDFTEMAASVVAIGTIGSFMVTGGLVQAIGRYGTFYGGQANHHLLMAVSLRLVGAGVLLGAAVAASLVAINLVVPYFTAPQLGIVLLYFGLLTPLWLLLAILYMQGSNAWIVAVTLGGTGVVHLVMTHTGWGIHAAHASGLIVANLFAAGAGLGAIRGRLPGVDKKYLLSRLPRPSVFFHIVEPFLIYGLLYFTFLFVDRLVGWSASEHRLPLFIWFRTSYELGMDWALVSLVFTMAVLEYTIHQFSSLIIPVQKMVPALDFEAHNRWFRSFYDRQRLLLLVIAVASPIATFAAGLWVARFDHIPEVHDFFASPVTYFTYWCAAVGYGLLAWALLNSLFYFSLAKPWVVVRSIFWGLIANVAVGFVLSRAISYEYSAIGLVVGAGVFARLMHLRGRELFAELDYFYYSAF